VKVIGMKDACPAVIGLKDANPRILGVASFLVITYKIIKIFFDAYPF
jgi:hypothetical protein